MATERIDLLRRMPIFGAIRDDILELVLSFSPTVCVKDGDFFFREGDAGEAMYVLVSGRVAVLKAKQGTERLIRHLEAGDCFGEMALMDYAPRSASILAVEDCEAIEISASCLHRIYETDVEQFALIEMNMGREVSRRLREADKKLSASE
jgi:CRP-like cAMP-binding protein